MLIRTLLLTLILFPCLSKAQFNLEELKAIRNYQIKSIYCDSLLENRSLKIQQQHEVIQAQKSLIFNQQEKEEVLEGEIVYYREMIQSRDKKITQLQKQNKVFKVGCIAFGSATAILALIILAP